MKVGFLPAADVEFRAAASYFESRVVGLGEEFIAEVEHMRSLLCDHPALGPRLDAVHRRIALRRFPFALIYRVDASEVTIVAVAHYRRRPGYWRMRRGRLITS